MNTTEFEKGLEELIGRIDSDWAIFMQSYEPYIKEFTPKLLAIARRLIAEEIDVAAMSSDYQDALHEEECFMFSRVKGYEEGVKDVIKEIRED